LAEAAALKKLATDYMHPEVVATATDVTLFGRNYFHRLSAPETEEFENADADALVLSEALALKKSAMDYMHPEVGVATTVAACSRNYFNRYSAAGTSDCEDQVASVDAKDARLWLADERAEVLAEAAALKNIATGFMHPEVGVTVIDATLFGRNWFNRPSAPEVESTKEADERALVLSEALALKKLAVDYMRPEVGVISAAGGRNYFNRYSAPETEEDDLADERAEILAEAAALKKLATDYMHPEVGITATDVTLFGRNWFNRPSAPELESAKEAGEQAFVLSEALALKKSATNYMRPEVGVTSAAGAGFGRNYFNRSSAPDTEDGDHACERAEVLAEAAALKNMATGFMHPEVGVTTTDGAAFGRIFFNRYSAPEVEKQPGSPEESQDVAAVKNLAAAVKGASLSGTESTKLNSCDQQVGETKKSASTVNLFGLSSGVF